MAIRGVDRLKTKRFLLAATLLLQGCGQYGDLYLPPQPQAQAPPSARDTGGSTPADQAPPEPPLDNPSEPLLEP